jgi:hypothetical protein
MVKFAAHVVAAGAHLRYRLAGVSIDGQLPDPQKIGERRGADQGQEDTLMSVRPGRLPLATLRDGLTLGRLADNAAMTMDSSAGALAPGETVAGETGRRCA